MGGLRTDAETQPAASLASSGGPAARAGRHGVRRRWSAPAAYLLAGAALFAVYLRLSDTYTLNSHSSNIMLMGWDLLHGHPLLHGWDMSDVSVYPTEIPPDALLDSFLGL